MILGPIGGLALLLFARAIWRKFRELYEGKFPQWSGMQLSVAATASIAGLYVLLFVLLIALVFVVWG